MTTSPFQTHGDEHGTRPPGEPPFGAMALRLANASWQLTVTAGVCTVVLGVLIMSWPGETLVVAAALFSIYLLVFGVFQLAGTFGHHVPGPMRALAFLSGAIAVLLGLVCLRRPAESILLLAFWIGFGWLLRGFSLLTQTLAFADMPSRGWAVFLGVMTILAGIVTIVAPLTSIVALTVLTGIWLIVIGASELAHGLDLRKHLRHAA